MRSSQTRYLTSQNFAVNDVLMSQSPAPPAYGTALEAARERLGISQNEAARRAGMSGTRWRQIVNGFQSTGGVIAPVKGGAKTVAKMAAVVDVPPEALEEAGRPDAARELRRLVEVAGDHPAEAAEIQADIRALQEEIVELMSELPPDRRARLERLIAEEEQEMQRMRQDRMRRLREMFQVTRQETDESR